VGSGPFRFVKYVPGQVIELEANPDYFFGRPVVDSVVCKAIKNIDTVQISMQRVFVDFIILSGAMKASTETYESAIADPRLTVVGVDGASLGSR
jgi:peptide/nickel transport system substrate-binding protein